MQCAQILNRDGMIQGTGIQPHMRLGHQAAIEAQPAAEFEDVMQRLKPLKLTVCAPGTGGQHSCAHAQPCVPWPCGWQACSSSVGALAQEPGSHGEPL